MVFKQAPGTMIYSQPKALKDLRNRPVFSFSRITRIWNTVRKMFLSQFKEYGRHAIIGFFKLSNDAKIENPNFNE